MNVGERLCKMVVKGLFVDAVDSSFAGSTRCRKSKVVGIARAKPVFQTVLHIERLVKELENALVASHGCALLWRVSGDGYAAAKDFWIWFGHGQRQSMNTKEATGQSESNLYNGLWQHQ